MPHAGKSLCAWPWGTRDLVDAGGSTDRCLLLPVRVLIGTNSTRSPALGQSVAAE